MSAHEWKNNNNNNRIILRETFYQRTRVKIFFYKISSVQDLFLFFFITSINSDNILHLQNFLEP